MNLRNLSVLNYANAFTLWVYKAPDTPLGAICTANYFRDACDMMSPGDLVLITAKSGEVTIQSAVSCHPNEVVMRPCVFPSIT